MILKGQLICSAELSGTLIKDKELLGGLKIPKSKTEDDYNKLKNKPQINSVELVGNRELEDLGIIEASAQDILNLF